MVDVFGENRGCVEAENLEACGLSSDRKEQSGADCLVGNSELRVEGAFVRYQCFCATPPSGPPNLAPKVALQKHGTGSGLFVLTKAGRLRWTESLQFR